MNPSYHHTGTEAALGLRVEAPRLARADRHDTRLSPGGFGCPSFRALHGGFPLCMTPANYRARVDLPWLCAKTSRRFGVGAFYFRAGRFVRRPLQCLRSPHHFACQGADAAKSHRLSPFEIMVAVEANHEPREAGSVPYPSGGFPKVAGAFRHVFVAR